MVKAVTENDVVSVLKGLNKEIPMGDIYWGALPFVLGTVVAIALLITIPALITWLPAVLR